MIHLAFSCLACCAIFSCVCCVVFVCCVDTINQNSSSLCAPCSALPISVVSAHAPAAQSLLLLLQLSSAPGASASASASVFLHSSSAIRVVLSHFNFSHLNCIRISRVSSHVTHFQFSISFRSLFLSRSAFCCTARIHRLGWKQI